MVESPVARLWLGRALFIGLMLLLMFIQLLPLQTAPQKWAAPDIILATTLLWTARRPDLVPVWSVALIFVIADLLFLRAPGLMAALVVIATEILRARAHDLRAAPFPVEWMTAGFLIIGVTIGNRAVLAVVMMAQAPLALTLTQMALTIIAYPVVAVLSQVLFGINRPAPGEVDSRGQKI